MMLLIAEPMVIWLLSPPAPLMPSLTFSFAVVLAAKVLMGDGAAALIDGATAPATTVEQMLAEKYFCKGIHDGCISLMLSIFYQ